MKIQKPKSWKTSFFGFASLVSGVAFILKGQVVEGITAITTALGLSFAKDYDQKD